MFSNNVELLCFELPGIGIKHVSESKNFLNFNESYPIFISFIIDSIVSTFLFFIWIQIFLFRFEILKDNLMTSSPVIDHRYNMAREGIVIFLDSNFYYII